MKIILATLVAAASAARLSHSEARVTHNFTEADFHYQGTGSPFEAWSEELDTPDCPSRVRRSRCSNDQFRGLVVFFHGYSACSEQVESVSEMLAGNCVDVLAPTYPGHGHAAVWCGEGGASCDVQTGNGMGWTHETLPTHRAPYEEFATQAHQKVQQEKNFRAGQTGRPVNELEVSLIGLSFGVPMALDLALKGGARHYTRQLLVNPYLALGDETIDQARMDCEATGKTHDECEMEAISLLLAPAGLTADSAVAEYLGGTSGSAETTTRSYFTNMAKLSDAIGESFQGRVEGEDAEGALAGLMEGEREWGSVCMQIWTQGRGGFCKFKQKHYLSTHSFSLHKVVDAQQWGAWSWGVPKTQIMTTERDGKTRNGIAYDLAQHLHSIDDSVSFCMHKFQHGTDRSSSAQYWDDANSMPHASLKGTRDAGRWWERTLFDNVRRFIVGGENTINQPVEAIKDRDVCEAVAIESGAQSRPEVLELVDIGIAPDRDAELWPGLVFNALRLTSR